ncbi:hypothetical protein LCGC14_0723010 [marine sediment metagenome]|uniref:Uncharacterized protein n=1 Tax=marine sediment metagenome TaxID=412755 RepID=A0A0F9QWV4_9ZZZZ
MPDQGLSIYGHDKATDPRYAPVDGIVPRGVIRYYACCETEEAPRDLVAFGLPYGSSAEFLLGRIDSTRPRQLWRRVGFPTPRGVQLLECVGQFPCTRMPDEPHEWWTWQWKKEQPSA